MLSNPWGLGGVCSLPNSFQAMLNKTSYGQQLLRQLLETILIESPLENHRPDWLFGLELDLYYPHSRVAFEFQGDHHFTSGIFGGDEELRKVQANDAHKARLCAMRGVDLRKVIAAHLTLQAIIGKLAWRRKTWARLKSTRLIHPVGLAQENAAPIEREAMAYRSRMDIKYGSATAFSSNRRRNGLTRRLPRLPTR